MGWTETLPESIQREIRTSLNLVEVYGKNVPIWTATIVELAGLLEKHYQVEMNGK